MTGLTGLRASAKRRVAPAVCLVLGSPNAVCLSSRDTPGMDTTGIRTHGGDVSSQTEGIKVDSWVSTVLHADSPPCAKSPTLKQVVLGRILTVLAQVWRVGSYKTLRRMVYLVALGQVPTYRVMGP